MSQLPPPVVEYAAPRMYSREFVPSQGRAKTATILLWVTVGFSTLTTLFSLLIAMLIDLDDINATGTLPNWFWPVIGVTAVVGFAHFGVYVATIVFYLRWQYQAQSNLYAIQRPPEYTSGWGVGYWFIPILNLFRPYQNLRDVTAKSHPAQVAFPALGAYWACWLISNITASISGRISEHALQVGVAFEVVSLILEIAAAFLLIRVMRYVVEGQAQQIGEAASVRTYV